jgi:hypothetical protein
MVRYTNYIYKSVTLFIAITILAACSGITVSTDWDQSVDFSKFKTFAVLENEDKSINRLNEQRIINALVAELTAKGLKKVASVEKADLAIGYVVVTEQRTSYQTVHRNLGGTHGFNSSNARFHGSMGSSMTTQFNYTVGTLVIAVYQMGNKDLIWEGSASSALSGSSNPERNQQRIDDAVQRILEDFPPGVSK